MKVMFWLMALGFVVVPLGFGQTNSWKGITPLYSNREMVEKTFGKPIPGHTKYLSEYKVGRDSVQVEYSRKPCDGGWDVPVGSVLFFSVFDHEKLGKSAEDLKLDETKFFITSDDAMYGTWTEPILGVQYSFMNTRMAFNYIKYIPRREDNYRRCDGFPPYVPEAYYFSLDESTLHDPKRNKTDDKFDPVARLENALIHLRANPGYRLYVLIYFDNKLSFKQYRSRVSFLKNWMFSRRKAKADEIIFIEGGLAEENRMELYILPRGMKAPAPEPTLARPQFRRSKA
jgi:hypothetical protein